MLRGLKDDRALADAPRRRWYDERIDLPAGHVRAFGRSVPALLAVAISTDSDHRRGRNRARLRDLVTEHR